MKAGHCKSCGQPRELADCEGAAVWLECRPCRDALKPQPAPTPNERPAVWDLVVADMRARDAVGVRRYGTRLQPHNGRDALRDAYEEALDLAVYLRQCIAERDSR